MSISRRLQYKSVESIPRALTAAVAMIALYALVPSSAAASRPSSPDHNSPEAVLRRSIDAARKINLRGTETVIVQPPRGNFIRMTREVVRTKNGVSYIKWIEPSAQRNVTLVDDGVWSRCYQPADNVVKVSRSTVRARDARSADRIMRLITRNYRLTLEGTAPMAGRDCYVLRLTPVHKISYTVKMWIDRANGALLGQTELASNGNTLSVSFFNGVEYPRSVDMNALRTAVPSHVRQVSYSKSPVLNNFNDLRKRVTFDFTAPYSMPGGYEFEHAEVLSLKGVTTTCLRYTDGLAEITVCQNYTSDHRPAGFRAAHPMVDPMGNSVVDYQVGPMNFYLVGRCDMKGLLAVTDVLDSEKERVYLSHFAKNYRTPMETVVNLRNQGLGLDTVDALLAISLQTRKPLSKLVPFSKTGHGWTAIARRFRADVERIVKHVRTFECR